MSGVNVRQAELEDWGQLLGLWHALKDSPQAFKIEGDENTLKAFFIGSLTSPHVSVWVSEQAGFLTGFVVTQVNLNPIPDHKGMVNMIPSCFIRAVYVDNRVAAPETVAILDAELCKHEKSRGCVTIYGNCRKNFPARAALKLYGYEEQYLVMRKEL